MLVNNHYVEMHGQQNRKYKMEWRNFESYEIIYIPYLFLQCTI